MMGIKRAWREKVIGLVRPTVLIKPVITVEVGDVEPGESVEVDLPGFASHPLPWAQPAPPVGSISMGDMTGEQKDVMLGFCHLHVELESWDTASMFWGRDACLAHNDRACELEEIITEAIYSRDNRIAELETQLAMRE